MIAIGVYIGIAVFFSVLTYRDLRSDPIYESDRSKKAYLWLSGVTGLLWPLLVIAALLFTLLTTGGDKDE